MKSLFRSGLKYDNGCITEPHVVRNTIDMDHWLSFGSIYPHCHICDFRQWQPLMVQSTMINNIAKLVCPYSGVPGTYLCTIRILVKSACWSINSSSGESRIWWKGGVNCHRQGRSPCSRHEVPSGGRVREGGVPPPHLKENGNQEMLRGLLKHTKIRIIVRLYCI